MLFYLIMQSSQQEIAFQSSPLPWNRLVSQSRVQILEGDYQGSEVARYLVSCLSRTSASARASSVLQIAKRTVVPNEIAEIVRKHC